MSAAPISSSTRSTSTCCSSSTGLAASITCSSRSASAATLQEAADADLLLHVIDAASPVLDEQQVEVERVLEEIGAADIPQILVYNKLDLLDETRRPRSVVDWLELPGGRRVPRVFLSARDGTGLPELRRLIAEAAQADASTPADASFASPSGDPFDDERRAAPAEAHDEGSAPDQLQRHA